MERAVMIDDDLKQWLTRAVADEASDVHLVGGYPPVMRLHGSLEQIGETQPIESEHMNRLLASCCSAHEYARFEQTRNLDFAMQTEILDRPQRFRVNFFFSGQRIGACFRIIPAVIPDFEWAGFPAELAHRLAHLRNGLVLFTGVTGAGKTTTLAMIINLLIREGGYRIITLEEPIEYAFSLEGNSLVTQREVGSDVETFADGLKYALRQDPDVLLVGEIRDRETAQLALSAAETGHLVFSTLHARDAKGAVSRFADIFPQTIQSEIRGQLASSLQAVVCQELLRSAVPGDRRILALEVMLRNAAISSSIRSGKLDSIDHQILTSRSEGMITMDESIKRLLHEGRIDMATAEHFVSDKSFLKR